MKVFVFMQNVMEPLLSIGFISFIKYPKLKRSLAVNVSKKSDKFTQLACVYRVDNLGMLMTQTVSMSWRPDDQETCKSVEEKYNETITP